MKRRPHRPRQQTYSKMHELMASATKPTSDAKLTYQLSRMWQAFTAIKTAAKPTPDDWRVCSDAVNMLETFCTLDGWLDCDGDAVEITDADGLLPDAVAALAHAGRRHLEGGAIRLDGAGVSAIDNVLRQYEALVRVLPARAVIRCHRATERRISDILYGKKQPHDVEIMAV